MGLYDEHKAFWWVGGIVFIASTMYTAFRGGGYESIISGLVIGAVCGGMLEVAIKRVKGEML